MAGLLLGIGCGPPRPPNIIVVLVDALRHDRLGVYGNTRNLTPTIDAMAREGTVFRRAYSQSSWTNASVASLMTSRYQSQHGVINFKSKLQPDEVAMAEILAAAGYATGGFSASRGISRDGGFAQGFAKWENLAMKESPIRTGDWVPARADEVAGRALDWLDTVPASKPTLLYLHFMEPHIPFDPSPEAVAKLVKEEDRSLHQRVNGHVRFSRVFPISAHMLGVIQDFYDAEVLSLDLSLEKLFAELSARGFLENSIVVITSDHGEEFREHDDIGHGMTLFEEVIRVPLIITRSEGGSKGRGPSEVNELVSAVDVAPTLLELAGVDVPIAFEGQSLVSLLVRDGAASSRAEPRTVLSELASSPIIGGKRTPTHFRALVSDDLKLIAAKSDDSAEFYHLVKDPVEQGAAAVSDDDRGWLRRALADVLETSVLNPAEQTERALDEGTLEKLRALGYAE